MIEDVKAFHERFHVPIAPAPRALPREEAFLRVAMMVEELVEFMQAVGRGDLPEAADALVDLAYFVLGTALHMGLPWDELWAEVHAANMRKVPIPPGSMSKRGGEGNWDVAKPEGWRPPDLARILDAHLLVEERRAERAPSEP